MHDVSGMQDRSYNLSKTLQCLQFFPHFSFILTFLLLFMNILMRSFSFRRMPSMNLSYDITRSITKCHNDTLDLKKSLFMDFFYDFSVIFNVFIKIHEYANQIICITYHKMKGLCLSFSMRPGSMV